MDKFEYQIDMAKIKITTQIFLACSDCDGMCNHCNEILRIKCQSVKK